MRAARIESLEAAIRRHRDERGDDRCWMDDESLYQTLPEGYRPPARDTAVELQHCERFIKNRRHPCTVYVSPQRRIEELEKQTRMITRFRIAAFLEGFLVGGIITETIIFFYGT